MPRIIALFCALLAVAGGPGVGAGANIGLTLEHPTDINLTIITDSDESGEFRVERVGPHAFKLVNFDASVQFALSPNDQLAMPTLTACNLGGVGDDAAGPWPLLDIVWTHADTTVTSLSLDADQCSTCVGCNIDLDWQP